MTFFVVNFQWLIQYWQEPPLPKDCCKRIHLHRCTVWPNNCFMQFWYVTLNLLHDHHHHFSQVQSKTEVHFIFWKMARVHLVMRIFLSFSRRVSPCWIAGGNKQSSVGCKASIGGPKTCFQTSWPWHLI